MVPFYYYWEEVEFILSPMYLVSENSTNCREIYSMRVSSQMATKLAQEGKEKANWGCHLGTSASTALEESWVREPGNRWEKSDLARKCIKRTTRTTPSLCLCPHWAIHSHPSHNVTALQELLHQRLLGRAGPTLSSSLKIYSPKT